MPNPTAAILIIGDEILSGRTQDTNSHFLAAELTRAGIDLCEIRVIGDGSDIIITALNTLRGEHDHVFTSGGIGPTHDDITADAVAAAFGVGIDVREDARAVMAARYRDMGSTMTPTRLRMARIPDGARLIDNPVSGAPGFSIGNVHVMAGVPSVFRAMVGALLPSLHGGAPMVSQSLRVERGESDIAEQLGDLAEQFSDLSIGSYPFHQGGIYGTNIVIRGQNSTRVDAAMAQLNTLFPQGAT